jgi:hypothetical protein
MARYLPTPLKGFAVANQGNDVVRTTSIERGGVVQQASRPTPIRRR